ncbi:MAG: ClbS/DfsB family four-helix bundle protein [Ktedonobacteraceae bacterium]
MSEYPGKAVLIDNIRTKQMAMEQALEMLNEQQMTTPGVVGAWSIKDVGAHISACERIALGRLQAAAKNTMPAVSWAPGEPTFTDLNDDDDNVDSSNNEIYQHNKDRSLQDVLAEFHTLALRIVDALQELSDDVLTDAQRFTWTFGNPLWRFIPGDSYEHVDEHLAAIQAWLATAGKD